MCEARRLARVFVSYGLGASGGVHLVVVVVLEDLAEAEQRLLERDLNLHVEVVPLAPEDAVLLLLHLHDDVACPKYPSNMPKSNMPKYPSNVPKYPSNMPKKTQNVAKSP